MAQLPTTVMTMAQMTKPLPAAQTQADQQVTTTAHNANDLDSLSNLMLYQSTWFKTTTTQLDTLATCQNKLETQTSYQLTTIMAQLETIKTLMEEQCNWQDSYNGYEGYDRDQPFTPDQMHMEAENYDTTNDTLALQAAGSSQMEDTSTHK